MDDTPEDKEPPRKAAPRKRAPVKRATAKTVKAKTGKSTTARKKTQSSAGKPAAKAAKPASPRKGKTAAPAKPGKTAKAAAKPKSNDLPEPAFGQAEAEASAKAKPVKRRPKNAPVAKLTSIAPAAAKPEQGLSEPREPSAAPVEVPADDVAIHPPQLHAPGAPVHDEGLEFGLSPVDLPADPAVGEGKGMGWFVKVLAMTSLLLVLFNSFAIDKWSRERPVTPLNSRVLITAQQFHAEMKGLHLDAPLEGMRSVWHGIKALQWPGATDDMSQPGEARAHAVR
ncbi:MAG: hypothetical protein AB7F98_13465 [Novosphingobium sp.]